MQINVNITFPAPAPPPVARFVGWRGKHYVTEGGREIPGYPEYKYPAVIPAYTSGAVIMTPEIQQMSYDLMARFCPTLDDGRWRTMHGNTLAMCNGTGFGKPAVDSGEELPKYDKVRTFQGSFRTGVSDGRLITMIPGIDGIDATKTMPSIDTIIAKHWYSIAVNVGDPPFHFRPSWGGVIAYPFIMKTVMSFEAEFFAAWNADEPPDPLRTYL